jgi:hypothetical protein
MREGFIYGLCAKSDGVIKYIGLTVSSLGHRLAQHKVEKRINKRTSWIKSVLNKGDDVSIIEIDRVAGCDLGNAEQRYIKMFLAVGAPLKNMTSGGETTNHSEETKLKLSEKKKGKPLSESHYKNVCEANKKRGLKKRGMKRSEAACKKTGDALRGRKLKPHHAAQIKARMELNKKQIAQYGLNGVLIQIWPSICECCDANNYSKGNIIKCCKFHVRKDGSRCLTAYGYKWKYHEDKIRKLL